MGNDKEIIKRFFNLFKKRHIDEAIVQSIPYLGTSLHTILYGGRVEDLIMQVQSQSKNNQVEIIDKLQRIISELDKPISPIIVFGSGNGEHLFRYEGKIRLGHKHSAKVEELYGGSGVNYALRLLKTDNAALPILSIGKDRLGKKIRDEIINASRASTLPDNIIKIIQTDDYFVPYLETPAATILSDGMNRTIFSQEICGIEKYDKFIEIMFDNIDSTFITSPSSVVIGHIHGDSKKCRSDAICTKKIIERYKNKSTIYANFGNSQIEYGIDYWEEYLESIDVFQLNLYEMKHLFRQSNKQLSLVEMIDWFKEREITAIITINRFGAVATYMDGQDGIIFSWPFRIKSEILEPTGAGDAFGAGVVSHLHKFKNFSHDDFTRAIKIGRIWGAYACTIPGGSKDCPDQNALNDFVRKNAVFDQKPVETRDRNEIINFLTFFDELDEHNLYFNLLKGA